MLPEEGLVVKSVERYSVGAHTVSNGSKFDRAVAHSFTKSSCDFLGMISSM